jgi:hypothetical protein
MEANMKVTDHFSLGVRSEDVPFVDVNVLRDNLLFVDPSAIRVAARLGYRWGVRADRSLRTFFDEILACLSVPAKYKQGEDSLAEFHEPSETRLGMSAKGYRGSGASRELGERIWRELRTNPVCATKVALLKRVEDIAIFVEDIANDRISDLTTRIIVRDLVAFTQRQMKKHPNLARNSINHEIQVWDDVKLVWDKQVFELPRVVEKGKKDTALILVPKRLVHIGLRMNPTGFWSIEAIGAVQSDETVVTKNGRQLKPNKDDLKKRPDLQDIRPTNTQQTMRIWERDKRSLVEDYRSYIDRTFEPVSDDQMDKKIPKK